MRKECSFPDVRSKLLVTFQEPRQRFDILETISMSKEIPADDRLREGLPETTSIAMRVGGTILFQ